MPETLSDLLELVIDHRGKTPGKLGGDFTDSGIEVVSAIHIKGGRIDWSQRRRWVSHSMYEKWMPVKLQTADLLLTSEAPLGEVALVPDGRDLVLSQRLFALRGKSDRLHTPFLYYYLQTEAGQSSLLARASGTTVVGIRQSELLKVVVPTPPIDEQRRIAEVLGALDDLIDTNQRLTASVAEFRKSLVGAAFQAATEWHPLSSTARFVNGKNFTKGADGFGRPIIRTPEVREGVKPSTFRSTVEVTDDFVARSGDLLFVWSGSLCIGRWVHGEALVNQHVFKVIPNEGVPDWYVYACLEWRLPWFIGLAADKATTMGHIQRAHLDAPVPKLSDDDIQRLNDCVRPLWELELELSRESAQLRHTRNELLPLLMSGKVRVRPAGVVA